MKAHFRSTLTVVCVMLVALASVNTVMAATNEAVDPGGGGVTLADSGQVTVNSAQLALVKQVWDTSGNCLASSPSDAGCNGGATSVTVPAGTTANFLIYVDNTTAMGLTDARIQDTLDDSATGFSYNAGSLTWNNNVTATGAAIATIYADAAGTGLTDAVDPATDIASAQDTGVPAGVDNITIGAVTGQVNMQLNVPSNTVFALRFQAVKQ